LRLTVLASLLDYRLARWGRGKLATYPRGVLAKRFEIAGELFSGIEVSRPNPERFSAWKKKIQTIHRSNTRANTAYPRMTTSPMRIGTKRTSP
jgi:hypothetical protein